MLDNRTKSLAAEGQLMAPNGMARDVTRESAINRKVPLSRILCWTERGMIFDILRVPFVFFRSTGHSEYSDGGHRGAVCDNRTDMGVTRASWANCDEPSVLLEELAVMVLVETGTISWSMGMGIW